MAAGLGGFRTARDNGGRVAPVWRGHASHGTSEADMPLLSRLLQCFRRTQPAPLPQPDAKLALGALMVRVAMSDRVYSLAEISLIDRVLARHFGLNPIEAARMRATCERLQSAAPRSDEFAALIRRDLTRDERMEALIDLWMVVQADGDTDDAEIAILEDTRRALGLSEDDSAEARASAAAWL